MKKTLLYILATGFWLTMMGLLIQREFFHASALRSGYQILTINLESREEYTAVQMGKEQVGFNFTVLENRKDRPESPYELRHQTYLSFLFLGERREMLVRGTADLDRTLKLQKFEIRISSSDYWTNIVGHALPQQMDLVIQSNEGDPIRRAVPLKEPVFYSEAMRFLWTPENLKPGKKGSFETWSPLLSNTQTVQFHVVEKTSVDYLGTPTEVYAVQLTSGGIETKVWVSLDGIVLREESATGFNTVKKEGWQIFDTMRTQKSEPPDLPNLFSIPAQGVLKNPRQIRSLTLKITHGSEETIQVIKRADLTGAESVQLPIPAAEDLKLHLESTPALQSEDPAIREKAKAIAGETASALEAVKKLSQWVQENISPVPSLSIPQARQVLGVRKGDCNEYTVLFTAFARAIGIPAKMIAGLVYHEGRFFYHAWSEVYLNRWIPVDPTFGQFPADVTHIPLTEGSLEEQVKLVTQLGKIRIQILDSTR